MFINTVTIADPDKDGDYLIINAADFDPMKHVPWDERGAAGDDAESAKAETQDPDNMTRSQMFAFLRARGETVAPASKDETLRERVRAIVSEG